MQLSVEEQGTTKVITLEDRRLDAAIAGEFKDQAREIADENTQLLVLDLSPVSFIDSSGIGAIVGLMKHMGRGRRMEICGLHPTVFKLFQLTRMDSVFVIHATREEALKGADTPIRQAG